MRRIVAVVAVALLVAACEAPSSLDNLPYSLNCGPLEPAECERQAAEIVSVITRETPERSISSIVFLNPEGHAQVILDDGTEVGWGERL